MPSFIISGCVRQPPNFLLWSFGPLTAPQVFVLCGSSLLTAPLCSQHNQHIEDISTWLEAFSIYCLSLVSYFPHRWKDLLQYQLLILHTYRQFSGRVWLSCNWVCFERMPLRLVWPIVLNSTACCLVSTWLAGPLAHPRFFGWPTRAPWFCFADYMQILDLGSLCGLHCVAVCPADTPNKPSSSSKHSPDSPPPWSSSRSCCV